jgi:itaconate CoA-transferase
VALPLEGITVVAFEQAVAAPLCSRHLGDLGARVIKIENPKGGDFTRQYDDVAKGMSSYFIWLNRNKESLALNLKDPAALEALERLLGQTDIVIQNLAPGAAGRIGVSSAQLTARFPRIIAVDISGYGSGGPLEAKRAYDLLVQAEGGVCSITGTPGSPAKPGPPVADLGAGMYSLSGILAALYARERTGKGAALTISMFDVVAEWMGFALQYTMHTGVERQPNGMSTPMVAPYGGYPTSDGLTVMLGTTNDGEWRRLCTQIIERPDLGEDPRLATNTDRTAAARDEIDRAIAEWTARHTLEEIQHIADAAGIGNSRYNTVSDVVGHPQLRERDRWRDVETPVGPVPCLLAPPNSPDWTQRVDPVPALGQHTDQILHQLGYTDETIAGMKTASSL